MRLLCVQRAQCWEANVSDIVERLRNDQGIGINLTLCREAADEIERLREALRSIEENENQFPMSWAARIARATLAKLKEQP